MTFGHPYVLWGLALLPVVALLYVRRAGRREAVVPNLALWRAAAAGAAPEAGKRRGALDLPMVFALLFLASALVAASDPVIHRAARQAPEVLVLVDRSASMAAKPRLGKTRSEQGMADVAHLLAGPGGAEVRLIGLPLASGRGIEPTELPLDLPAELSRCAGLARGASAVMVMTDDAGAVPERLGGAPVLVVSHGGPSQNVAVDAFEVTRDDEGRVVVFAAVRNYSAEPMDVPAVIAAGEAAEIRRQLRVPADGCATLVEPLPDPAPDRVELVLEVGDDLASDNRAVAVRSGGRTRVAYVGRGNPFIERALGLLPRVALRRFRLTTDVGENFDLFLYDGVTPDRLPKGVVVLIDPAGTVGPFRVLGALTDPTGLRAAQAKASPLLVDVDVGTLRFRRVLRIEAPPAAEALLTAGEETALVRWADAEREVLVIGCALSLSETNWPHLPSFPIFWSNLLARLERPGDLPTYSLTGEHISFRARTGAEAAVTGPDGEPVPVLPAPGARRTFLPTKAGVYTVRAGPSERAYAVNMMHPSESDTSGSPAGADDRLLQSALARAPRGGVSLWKLLTLAAVVLAFATWATSSRRIA